MPQYINMANTWPKIYRTGDQLILLFISGATYTTSVKADVSTPLPPKTSTPAPRNKAFNLLSKSSRGKNGEVITEWGEVVPLSSLPHDCQRHIQKLKQQQYRP